MSRPVLKPIAPSEPVEIALGVVRGDRFPTLAIIDGDQLGSIDNPALIGYRIEPARVLYMQEWALEY